MNTKMMPVISSSSTSSSSRDNGDNTINQEEQQEQKQAKKNGWKENGFEEFGGYMAAKKSKLDVQINNTSNFDDDDGGGGLGIFNGISIYINGHTIPPEPELRKLFVEHGGSVHIYRSSKTNFVIASNLSASSKNLYGHCTVKPEWISDSISARLKLNYRDYLLYNLNEENNQRTLTQMITRGGKQQTPTKSAAAAFINNEKIPSSSSIVPNLSSGTLTRNEEQENEILAPSDDDESAASKTVDGNQLSGGHRISADDPVVGVVPAKNNFIMTAGRKIKTATEDGFLEDFFQNSRLHLISDQKKEMQNKIGKLRKSIVDKTHHHSFDYLQEFIQIQNDQNNNNNCDNNTEENLTTTEPITLMHIDLDCFFVSVGLLSRPHLRGKPVVVTHSTGKGDNSKSDIASASYEARKFGVSNGMWVAEAKKLCPSLEVVPYDFEEYRRVSNTFFDTVAKVTLDIEPMSVDEMVLDASAVLQKVPSASPIDLAEFIRRKIFEAVQCTASVGIGRNKLLAKLATKKAKPNGVYHLTLENAQEYIQELEVRELPGIGWSHESKLHDQFKVQFCKELLLIPVQALKNEFGVKTAEKIIQSCKGLDSAELKYGFDRPKSISVDVNYGIRFTTDDQISDFLLKLCKELSTRAIRAQATGVNLTLKILSRKKGADKEPKKHGGHGIVDSLTRSTRLFQPTNDWNQFFRMVLKVIRLLTIPASDYRGIGMSLTDLTFEFDKSANQKKEVQRTLFDVTTSRGKQMLDVVRKSSNFNNKRDSSTLNQLQPPPPLHLQNGDLLNGDALEEEARIAALHKSSSPTPKRRKLDFSNNNNNDNIQSSSSRSSAAVSTNNNPPGIAATDSIDLNVLRELPEDIAREVAKQYGIDFDKALKLPSPSLPRPNDDDDEMTSTTSSHPTVDNEQAAPNITTATVTSSNPYSDIESIDPAYLCALPEAIRNEVLLQFQEAKGKSKEGITMVVEQQQNQPCSSRQALERDKNVALLKSLPNKNPIQSTDTHDIVPEPNNDIQNNNRHNLQCDEQMCEEFVYTTPPSVPSSTRNSTSQGRFRSRQNSTTPLSSRRRLDFTEKALQPDAVKSERASKFNMKKFLGDKSFKFPFRRPLKSVTEPDLNGAINIEDVRNIIREGIANIPNPEADGTDAVDALTKYFHSLIDRGYLKQGQLLLKFLCRKYESLPEESLWRSIIEVIVNDSQELCLELYDCELDLEL